MKQIFVYKEAEIVYQYLFFIWLVYQDTVFFCLHIWKQTVVYKEAGCSLPIHLLLFIWFVCFLSTYMETDYCLSGSRLLFTNTFVCCFFLFICWSEHFTVFILCIGKKIENLLVLLTADCCWPFKSEAIDLGIQLMIVVKYFPTFAFFALCPFSLPNAASLKLSWAEVTLFFFFSASDRLIFSPLKKVLKVDLISVYCKR